MASSAKPHDETWAILKLSLPIFVSVSSFIGMKVTDTAILGHVGTKYLAAASLSDIYTTSTMFLIGARVLTTFCGQAWGAGNKPLVGIWLQVSLFCLAILAIPVFISWNFVPQVLAWFKANPEDAHNAGRYASILSLSIPAQVVFNQGTQYFQAQQLLSPTVTVTCAALILNVLLNVFIVLGAGIRGFDGFGFIACPSVTTFSVYFQAILFFGIFFFGKGLHKPTWPGWKREHITKSRIKKYMKLYVPAAFQFASEFWRFNLVGGLAAHLGEKDLAAFNSSYKVIYLVHQFALSVGIATNIRVGILLGNGDHRAAKNASWNGLILAGTIAGSLAAIVAFIPATVAQIFSSDPDVLQLFRDIAPWLSLTIFFMSTSDTLQQILVAQARAKALAFTTFLASWAIAVPASFGLVFAWKESLAALYLGVVIGYAGLFILLLILMRTSDWQAIADDAQDRSEMKGKKDEESPLLSEEDPVMTVQ